MFSLVKILEREAHRMLTAGGILAPEFFVAASIAVHRYAADAERPVALPRARDAGAIAVQTGDARAALVVVQSGGVHFRAGDQHAFVDAGANELVGDPKRKHETGALGADIERADRAAARGVLEIAPRPGENDIRSHGGEHDEVDHVSGELRACERRLRRAG